MLSIALKELKIQRISLLQDNIEYLDLATEFPAENALWQRFKNDMKAVRNAERKNLSSEDASELSQWINSCVTLISVGGIIGLLFLTYQNRCHKSHVT